MKMNIEIKLVLPTNEFVTQIEEYKRKFLDEKSGSVALQSMPGCGNLEKQTVDEWIAECNDHSFGRNLPDGYVSATQFIAMRKADSKLVGMIQVRHKLTPFLERIGGHIGYSIAPDERRKGYATQMLTLALDKCRELGIERVRVTCIKENIASAKVIQNCGGKFDGEAEYDGEFPQNKGKIFYRYWIDLAK